MIIKRINKAKDIITEILEGQTEFAKIVRFFLRIAGIVIFVLVLFNMIFSGMNNTAEVAAGIFSFK